VPPGSHRRFRHFDIRNAIGVYVVPVNPRVQCTHHDGKAPEKQAQARTKRLLSYKPSILPFRLSAFQENHFPSAGLIFSQMIFVNGFSEKLPMLSAGNHTEMSGVGKKQKKWRHLV